jgi:hypothetical protein
MTRNRSGTHRLLALILCAFPAALHAQEPPAPRLGTLLHPLPVQQLSLRAHADAIPQEKKDRVHFYLINGLDPLQASNVHGVAAYFRSIGFTNTTSYQFPATPRARREIEAVRRSDPQARIVLLGFSVGANCARGLANSLNKDGVTIDCLVYVGGDTVFNTPTSKPANVGQIVNVTGHGLVFLGRDVYFKGDAIDGAINQRLDARHMSIPGNRATIELVGQQLLALANKSSPPAETPSVVGQTQGIER